MKTEQNAQMTLDEKINFIFNEIKKIDEVKRSMKANKKLLEDFDKKFKEINRKIKDIESDQRTTQAFGRVIQASGISFKDTRIPYPLQGNAAIEDIKDYY